MSRAGFSFCICPDGRLLREYVAGCLAAHALPGVSWERHVFWGDEDLPPVFWEHLAQPGLFADVQRALIVRQANALPAALWKRLSTALASPAAQCWPFLCLEVAWEKGQPKIPAHIAKLKCLEYAERQKWVWRQAGLDGRNLRAFVQKEAHARGLRFEAGALDALCAGLVPDASAVAAELDKLCLAAPDALISPSLAAQAAYVPPFDIFRFLRTMQAGDMRQAWNLILRARLENEGLLFPLLPLLLREVRQLWQLAHGETVRSYSPDSEARQRLALSLGPVGLARFFALLFTAELAVKSGERQPDQALDALIADLGLLLAPARAQGVDR